MLWYLPSVTAPTKTASLLAFAITCQQQGCQQKPTKENLGMRMVYEVPQLLFLYLLKLIFKLCFCFYWSTLLVSQNYLGDPELVQNVAAHTVLVSQQFVRIKTLVCKLHQVQFKVMVITFKPLNSMEPIKLFVEAPLPTDI